MAFGGHHIACLALAHHDRRAAEVVASGDDAIFGEDDHRAGAFHLVVDVADAVYEVLSLGDEEGHQLGGVGEAHAQLGEVLLVGEAVVDQLVNVVDFGHRADGELAEVRVDDDGLCVGVADNADAEVALKLIHAHFIAELSAEIGILDVVDRTVEHSAVIGHYARTLGAEM